MCLFTKKSFILIQSKVKRIKFPMTYKFSVWSAVNGFLNHFIYRNLKKIFDFQEFFFDNVTVEDLNEKCLTILVCHQSQQKLQKDIVIGDLYLPLKNLSELRSKKEVRIIEELKHRINTKVCYIFIFLI